MFALHANLSYLFVPGAWPALPPFPQNPLQVVLGLGLMVAGLAGVAIAMSGLGLRTIFGQRSDALRQSGLYGVTRNPQIVFYGVVVVGYALLWVSWGAVGWALLYVPIAHMMIVTEEEHLRRVHGKAYETYCERVPRYLVR